MPKIIAHYQREDEPRRSDRSAERATNLRCSDARIIAHRHLDDAESTESTFQNHLNSPAVTVLLELQAAKDVCSPGAERPEVAYTQAIQKPDQKSRQTVTKRGVPRQSAAHGLVPQARTQCDISPALNDWTQEKRQLIGSIAVIAVEEHYNVGAARTRQSR